MTGATDRAFRVQLRALRDQVLVAIDGRVLGDIEDGLALYERLAVAVLAQRASYGDSTLVNAPTSWRNRYGREMQWLNDDLHTFVERAWTAPNLEVLRLLAQSLLHRLDELRRAGEPEAHRQALELAESMYWRSLDEETQQDDRDTSGRNLLTSIRSYAEFQVLLSPVGEEGEVYLDQIVGTLATCWRMAVDRRPNRATGCVIEIRQLLDTVQVRRLGSDAIASRGDFESLVGGYLLGMFGYLLMTLGNRAEGHDAAVTVGRVLLNALELVPPWVAIQSALDDYGPYPWSWWETRLWPDGVTGGVVGELAESIRLGSLALLSYRGAESFGRDSLANMSAADQAYFLRRLANTKSDASMISRELQGVLDDLEGVDVEIARAAVATAAGDAEAASGDERAGLPLNPDKVSAFAEAVAKSWSEDTALRGRVLAANGRPEEEPRSWFGYNRIEPKDLFTDSAVIGFPASNGETIGRALVRGEIERTVNSIRAVARTADGSYSIREAVLEEIRQLRGRGYTPTVLVLREWDVFSELAGVSPTSPGAEDASIDGVPVWFEFLDGQPGCLVFDPERCFHITRWQLAEDIPGARYFDGTLSVNVREIDDSYAATLLADNPNLSVSEDGDQLTTDEAIRRLRRLVQVQAMTKSRLDLIDADAAVWIPISTPRKSKFTHVSGPPIV